MLRRITALLFSAGTLSAAAQTPLQTVPKVDLPRYAGKWFELARLPNRFEKKCARDVTAEYTLQGSQVLVVNSCTQADGSRTTSRGKAKIADPATNAKLRVTFFWPFYGNYWVIGLDPEYRWAIVGEPKREYLWILSRTPTLPQPTLDTILQKIKDAGYNPASLLYPQQSPSH